MVDCPECGLPAEIEREYTLAGVGFGDYECIVMMRRTLCVDGHRRDAEYRSIYLNE